MFFENLWKDIFLIDENDVFPILCAVEEEIDENSVIDFDSMTDEEIRSYYE